MKKRLEATALRFGKTLLAAGFTAGSMSLASGNLNPKLFVSGIITAVLMAAEKYVGWTTP